MSLVAGLALAVVVFVVAGGWGSFGGHAQERSGGDIALSQDGPAPASTASLGPSDSVVLVVVLVSSEAEVEAAAAQYASTADGWHTEVLVLDDPDSELEFQNAFNSLLRHGGTGSYRVVDLIRR